MEVLNTESNACIEADDSQSFVESELEALQSIYINEIEVRSGGDKNSTSVSIDLHPATADKTEEQYVKMTLKFTLNEEYPQTTPEISIRNPRGLSDEKLNSIHQVLISIAEEKIGNSMLFEIIEAAKEHLTAENRPCGECAICLYGFSEEDVFTKTDCYHYFHSHCLARYAKNAIESETEDKDSVNDDNVVNNELLCPMCRVPIKFEGFEGAYPPPRAGDDEYVINERILEVQKMMADLYQKQLEKGGIIDVEAEKNKYLLEISTVPTRSSTVEEEDGSNASNNTEENSIAVPQPLQKDKIQQNKEDKKDSKNTSSKYKERTRNDKYSKKPEKQGNNKSRFTNNYGPYRKSDKYSELNEDNLGDEADCRFALDNHDTQDENDFEETGVLQNKDAPDASPNLKPVSKSPDRKEKQKSGIYPRNKRDNYDDYGRDGQFRNPYHANRSRGRGYSQNLYQRYNRPYQESRGYDPSKSNNYHSNANRSSSDAPSHSNSYFEESRSSFENRNVADSYKRNFYDRGHYRGRGRYQGKRHPDNYPRKPYPRQNSDRNACRQEDNDNYRERNSQSKNDYPSKYEKDSYHDSKAYAGTSPVDDPTSIHVDEHISGSNPPHHRRRNSNKGYGASLHERNSPRKAKAERKYETEAVGDDATSHKNQTSENQNTYPYEDKAQDKEFAIQEVCTTNEYAHEDSSGQDKSYPNSKSDDLYDQQPSRERKQYPNRNNFNSGENGEQFQRSYPYSQGSASRRNAQRNSYGNNPYNQTNYRDKGRGRNNYRFQNRNPYYKGNQRKFNHEDENPEFRNDGDSQKHVDGATKKFSGETNASSHNGRLSEDFLHVTTKISSEDGKSECNYAKGLNTNVKPFIPKEDLSISNVDATSFKNLNIDPELSSQKLTSPPPGFNNPSKKVVYGLKAANPPPGFPRR